MDEDSYQWTEDECEQLVGHCWERLNIVGLPETRRCRHCGRKEEHQWVKP